MALLSTVWKITRFLSKNPSPFLWKHINLHRTIIFWWHPTFQIENWIRKTKYAIFHLSGVFFFSYKNVASKSFYKSKIHPFPLMLMQRNELWYTNNLVVIRKYGAVFSINIQFSTIFNKHRKRISNNENKTCNNEQMNKYNFCVYRHIFK
jgi:hypothetical protein